MPTGSALPIHNKEIDNFISNFSLKDNEVSLEEYIQTYSSWISGTRRNHISGLETYKFRSFIHGTIHCFDTFYLKHCQRRFRFYRGEFMYHKAVMKHNLNWKFLNESIIEENDAVIISVPFSDSGKVHLNLKYILERCEELKVPVLLDLAYLSIARNVNIDVNYTCIDSICTSLSKTYEGAQFLRAGLRLQRQNLDDGIDMYNSVNMIPKYTLALATKLMQKYPIDYNWDQYQTLYESICQRLNLEETDCIIFGTSKDNYKEFNRGNDFNRVCISPEISEVINASK